MKIRTLLTLILLTTTVGAQADAYESLWKKAQKAQSTQNITRAHTYINKVYDRALNEGNTQQLTRALYAYDALQIKLPDDSIVNNAQRIWTARRNERDAVQHALLTHLLGRLTDNDYLLALSVTDTTFLKQQKVRDHLPLVKGYALFDLFGDYLRQRDMPDSVFVGWESADQPEEEEGQRKVYYDFNDTHAATAQAEDSHRPVPSTRSEETTMPSGSTTPTTATPPALTGNYCAFVFNVPGGASRVSLMERESGMPVPCWKLHRSDGHGQESDIVADGNGHVWQRPSQIHDYNGIYDWRLRPVVENEGFANTLKADNFHDAPYWGAAATQDESQLRIEMDGASTKKGHYSFTVRAPHRNLALMRDITVEGRLVEQRLFYFSDFIHFDIYWRESFGDEATVTFAYVLEGRLYTTQTKISRPR